MGVERTPAIVIGGFPLGESDRLVTFFTQRFGKVRGVAKSARRMRSRFGAALELFTSGELVFFDSGRSELVQVDHFDIVRPFEGVRSDLERLGHAAFMVECVARLTAERDPAARLFTLLTRALTAVEANERPSRIAVVFAVRCIDLLGHRLRTDACVGCGRRMALAGTMAVDVEAGGTVCASCVTPGSIGISAAALTALQRLRSTAWKEVAATHLARVEPELRGLLERHVATLIGQSSRASRFLREVAET
jgi:DNA repair protein RecO (recombination protein O)